MKKISKYLRRIIVRFCEFNIIINKTIITSVNLIEDLESMNDVFNQKIKKAKNITPVIIQTEEKK